ncbi:MAG: helix-turn-helix domain-containing protein, partial [Candidatus Methylomirabilis sp.]|nr:helix-turn-helix domain-containing protein [Deltaproteobacteria bacterium]
MKTLYLDQVRGIHEVFYRARHFPRKISLQKFAEVLGSVNAAQLGAIETGERLPSEELVKRLAEYLRVSEERLLVILRVDRILQRFVTELEAELLPKRSEETAPAEGAKPKKKGPKYRTYSQRNRTDLLSLDLAIKRLISAFPTKDHPLRRDEVMEDLSREFGEKSLEEALDLLVQKGNIREDKTGRTLALVDSHYKPDTPEEKLAWATNFCATVIKGVFEACVQGYASGEGWAQDFFY